MHANGYRTIYYFIDNVLVVYYSSKVVVYMVIWSMCLNKQNKMFDLKKVFIIFYTHKTLLT